MNWTFANSNTIVQLRVPDELRGRVMGTYSVVFIGMFPLGTLMMGWAARNFGVDKALLVGSIIAAIVATALFVRYPKGNANK
jgi:MFS-type transporter involved in bile tolerance (Atg22 family)